MHACLHICASVHKQHMQTHTRTHTHILLPASQIEESYISAEEFCRAARQDASVVLKGEVGVLQVRMGLQHNRASCQMLYSIY